MARYEQELAEEPAAAALTEIAQQLEQTPVCLVTASREVEHSHLPVLARLLTSDNGRTGA